MLEYHILVQTMPAWDRIVLRANKYVHVLIMLKLIMSNVEICQQPICKLIPDHNVGVDMSSVTGSGSDTTPSSQQSVMAIRKVWIISNE